MDVIINKATDDIIKLIVKTKEIARKVELMIVIGKKDTPTTTELYNMAVKGCNNAMIVEKMEDLYLNYIKRFKKIGLSIEPSFPGNVVEDIINTIKNTKTGNYLFEVGR